ncbi:HAAS signaling domain-containing protein [Microbacterium sp. CFBP9034]|uniref:HAAS signaling domain-containing protein n=1 Tax=Microbacterium sp. CFBP9034 TaxID=3096540 RepID=UPI002A6A8D7C|nr:hypothetical protein [Microbacterium sp. CFBP9034]MDY0909038.1 hypothetical protein [Microbacterium sp. CFBP9034]
MADTTEVLQHPAVRAYLTDLHRAVAAKDPAQADAVMAGVADHIRDAAADADARGARFEVDAVLRELGDPAFIAADVEPAAAETVPPTRAERFSDSWGGVVTAVLLLTVGTLWLTMIGWAAALCLVWASQRWSRADKVVATAVWPVVVVIGSLTPLFARTGIAGWHLVMSIAIALPAIVGIWLLVRSRGPIARREHAVRPSLAARAGVWGWVDRWPGAALAISAPPLAATVVLVPALLPRTSVALPATTVGGAVLLAAGIAVLWTSRGWTLSGRVCGTGTAILTALVTWWLVATSLSSTAPLRRCGPDGCEELPARLADPGALLLHVAQLVVPLLAAHAITVASGFRSGAPAPRALDGRRSVITIVLVLLGGTASLAAYAYAVAAGPSISGTAFACAVAGVAVWSSAATLVLRSPAWRPIDRVIGVVPAVLVVWLCAGGSPFGAVGGMEPRYADPLVPLVPLAAQPLAVLALLVFVQAAASAWLLAAAGVWRRTPAIAAKS